MIKIIVNADAFGDALQEKYTALSSRLLSVINDLSVKLQARILNRPGTPVSADHRRKGWLANSVRAIPATAEGSTITGGTEAAGGAAWYGRLFEEGTFTAYPIVATNTKALRFELGGQAVFVRSVVHPAFNPMKLGFMRPAFDEMEPEMVDKITAAVNEVMKDGSTK